MNEKEKQLELEKAMKTCDKAWRTYGKAAAQLESYSKAEVLVREVHEKVTAQSWKAYKKREACYKHLQELDEV